MGGGPTVTIRIRQLRFAFLFRFALLFQATNCSNPKSIVEYMTRFFVGSVTFSNRALIICTFCKAFRSTFFLALRKRIGWDSMPMADLQRRAAQMQTHPSPHPKSQKTSLLVNFASSKTRIASSCDVAVGEPLQSRIKFTLLRIFTMLHTP